MNPLATAAALPGSHVRTRSPPIRRPSRGARVHEPARQRRPARLRQRGDRDAAAVQPRTVRTGARTSPRNPRRRLPIGRSLEPSCPRRCDIRKPSRPRAHSRVYAKYMPTARNYMPESRLDAGLPSSRTGFVPLLMTDGAARLSQSKSEQRRSARSRRGDLWRRTVAIRAGGVVAPFWSPSVAPP